MSIAANLKSLRKEKKLSQIALARLSGVSQQLISQIENGVNDSTKNLPDLARALGVPVGAIDPSYIAGTRVLNQDYTVSVVGYVGAGAEVLAIDDHEMGDGLESVEVQFPVPEGTVAVVVRGTSMMPVFQDGDLIGYVRENDDPRDIIGETCIVKVLDGPVYIKRLRRGSEPGLFTLVSTNATMPDIEDVELEWAAAYQFHLPARSWRRLTK